MATSLLGLCDNYPMSDFEPDQLTISSLLGGDFVQVSSAATLVEVAQRMTDEGISAVGVGDGELLGVLTERDVVRAVAAGRDPETKVGDLAETELVWTSPDAPVDEVAEEMMNHWIRHVFVGHPGELLGIVSIRDLLIAYINTAGI